MELVEDKDRHTFKGRIFYQHPRQDALGHNFDPRTTADFLLETDPIPHRLSYLFAQQLSHPPGNLPRGYTPRLQHDDLPTARLWTRLHRPQSRLRLPCYLRLCFQPRHHRLQNRQRQHRRLSSPGRRRHNHCPASLETTVQRLRNSGSRKLPDAMIYLQHTFRS